MLKGIFFSSDPGGTNALIPVARRITEEAEIQIVNYASFFAVSGWEQAGLDFTPLPDTMTADEIGALVSQTAPDFIFTGTSENPDMEGRFWRAAKHQAIATYSIIDHWTRYKERYMVNGSFSPTDIIFTIDETSKEEMISLGFKKESIIVSGQPHFEKFYDYKSRRSRAKFCEDQQLPEEKRIITFVSDNISGSFPSASPGKPLLGFDEHTTLSALLTELDPIYREENNFQLIIKLHPKEPEDNFANARFRKAIPCRIIKGGDNMDLIFHSDYVIGMFSMLLFEAFLMNKPVLSLQLNANHLIPFGNNQIPTVVDPTALSETLKRFLSKSNQQQQLPYTAAVKKIIETLKENLGSHT